MREEGSSDQAGDNLLSCVGSSTIGTHTYKLPAASFLRPASSVDHIVYEFVSIAPCCFSNLRDRAYINYTYQQMLKKLCRERGVLYWPQRQINAINKSMERIRDCYKGPKPKQIETGGEHTFFS